MVKPKNRAQTYRTETVQPGDFLYPPESKIGARIKEAREKIGLNFEQLARLTVQYDSPRYEQGISAAMLARYERDVNDGPPVLPGARELRLLCEALEVRADWLLLGIVEDTESAKALLKAFKETLRSITAWHAPLTDDSFNLMAREEKLRRARASPRKSRP